MFTGIVEEVGTVRAIDLSNPLEGLLFTAQMVLNDTKIGDSIAVNGACLTVTRLGEGEFAVGVMPETLRRTNLGTLAPGNRVNLERAMLPATRMGGHFVQGHVDGTGTVTSIVPDGTALAVRIATTPDVLHYVVEKGFIAVDGASLTVTGVDGGGFGVALIPYTQEHVGGNMQRLGGIVNLEVDILAKYVEKLMAR